MRLIDAHALYREYQEKVCDGIACHECKATNKDGTCKLDLFISTAPTIDIEERLSDAYAHGWSDAEAKYHDAVEVVRCGECKYWICNPNTEEWGKCKWISDEQFDVVMNADDFCSYGEHKDESQTSYKKWTPPPKVDLPTVNTTCVTVLAFALEDEPQMDDFFRELTAEERKAVAEYIESISIPTGVNVFDLMDEPQMERSE